MTLLANAFRFAAGAGALGLVALPLIPEKYLQPSPPTPITGSAPQSQTDSPPAAATATPLPTGPALAYAPEPDREGANPLLHIPPPIALDQPGLREALAAYAQGDIAKGDEWAAQVKDPIARLALDWVALQKESRLATFQRLSAFLAQNPDWAARGLLERRAEDILFNDRSRPQLAGAWFATRNPQTPAGKLALARAELAAGQDKQAKIRIAASWRHDDMSPWLEGQFLKEFGAHLAPDDHRYRALRLAYDGKQAATRIAAKVDENLVALIKARLAVAADNSSEKLMQGVPAALRQDPAYLLSQAQRARRAGDLEAATKFLEATPREREKLIDPDEFWVERRVLARKWLDAKKPEQAYKLCAEHSAQGREQFIEAEFHAGWIALRFLDDPKRAAPHFERAAQRAETPISRARAAYWQARTAEARGDRNGARNFYRIAAKEPVAYYGQLARARLGETMEIRQPRSVTRGDARASATRVSELLFALGEKDMAGALAMEAMRGLDDEAQMAALADVVARNGDARITLAIGKLALQRGHFLDIHAFPLFGIPAFEPATGSAPLPIVYAIARQESAFAPRAVSSAGAKGLMQMIDSTARRTAQQIGVEFERDKLLDDPAFNARLGAAHLGQLLTDFRGSHILAFVAYNAGPRRAREWIEAYGDPRDPAIDPIDWIERIPFSETRNYVQRVIENLEIYRLRFGDERPFALHADLRAYDQRL